MEKVKTIDETIIIGLVKKITTQKQSKISYSFYHPFTGEKLDPNKICLNEEIILNRNIEPEFNSTDVDLESFLFLLEKK